MASNFDIEKMRLPPLRFHRRPPAVIDTKPSKADIAAMEAQIAALNAHMEHVRSGLDSLDRRVGVVEAGVADTRERLSRVETKIEHLPSKGYIVTALTIGAGAVVGLLTMLSKLGILAAG